MIPIKQTILHDPDNGCYGNCNQAALASLLELSLEDVPHIGHGIADNDGEEFNRRLNKYLKTLGYCAISFPVFPDALDEWTEYVEKLDTHHLLIGYTDRFDDVMHVVVAKNMKVVHDPHPDNSGLLPPTDEKPWYVEFLVKLL